MTEGTLLNISGVWVRDPDADSWNPVNNPTWTPNSGRVCSGTAVGSRQYFKYKLPLKWSNIPEEDSKTIQELIENGDDYIIVKFYHKCGYIQSTFYSAEYSPKGIYKLNGKVFYKEATVNLVEK